MSILQFLGLVSKKVNDDFFGKLEVSTHKFEDKKYQHFYFEKYFPPTKSVIWVTINSYSETPSNVQKEIYKYLESNYDAILELVSTKLKKDYATEAEKFNINVFKNEFTLNDVYLEDEEEGAITWWLDYKSKPNEDIYFEVHFEKLEIDYLEIDKY